MANYDFPAPEAVALPNLFLSPGDALQQAAVLKERRDERNATLKQQQEQRYGLANLKNLNDTTDKINLPLGNDYANTIMNSEAKKVYDKLISQVNTTDPVTFDYLLHREADNLFGWEKKFRSDLDFTQKFTEDVLKSNQNLDPNLTKQTAQSLLESRYFQQTPNGDFERKHPDEIPNDQTFVSALEDPNMQGLLATEGIGVLRDYIQSQKLQPAKDSDYVSNKGYVDASAYDAKYNPSIKRLVIDEHGNPTLQTITEDANLGNGINLRMIPKAVFDDYMSKKNVASGINKMWNPKKFAIEQKFAQAGGTLDPHSEEMLKRDFVRQQIEDNGLDLSYIAKKEKQVVPKPPHISVNVNTGKDVAINDIYGEVNALGKDLNAYDQNHKNDFVRFNSLSPTAQDVLKKYLPADADIAQVGIRKDENGGYHLFLGEPSGIGLNFKYDLVPITYQGINLPANKPEKERQKVLKTTTQQQQPSANEFEQYKRK